MSKLISLRDIRDLNYNPKNPFEIKPVSAPPGIILPIKPLTSKTFEKKGKEEKKETKDLKKAWLRKDDL
jgi:hypothetical protein